MIYKYRVPISNVVEQLQVVGELAGLTPEDIRGLLDSGVTVTHLLDYLEAVASDRLN